MYVVFTIVYHFLYVHWVVLAVNVAEYSNTAERLDMVTSDSISQIQVNPNFHLPISSISAQFSLSQVI